MDQEETKHEGCCCQGEAEDRIRELETSLKKLMADFDNHRKRTERERKLVMEQAGERIMCDLLEVLDDFERGLESDVTEEAMRMVYRKLKNTLEEHGLKCIEAHMEEFDPLYHECVYSEEVEEEEKVDKVLEEIRKGYSMNSRVLRPSKVKVGKKKEEVIEDE